MQKRCPAGFMPVSRRCPAMSRRCPTDVPPVSRRCFVRFAAPDHLPTPIFGILGQQPTINVFISATLVFCNEFERHRQKSGQRHHIEENSIQTSTYTTMCNDYIVLPINMRLLHYYLHTCVDIHKSTFRLEVERHIA